jgi:ssDNA-binding Zn-finger/Zn-ribbon topoisomerase 1
MTPNQNAYGFCPKCGAPGVQRERRPDGNDKCQHGHVYPSKSALPEKPASNAAPDDYAEWQKQDAARLNWLCQEARKSGIVLPTGGQEPPALNPDGSLATEKAVAPK